MKFFALIALALVASAAAAEYTVIVDVASSKTAFFFFEQGMDKVKAGPKFSCGATFLAKFSSAEEIKQDWLDSFERCANDATDNKKPVDFTTKEKYVDALKTCKGIGFFATAGMRNEMVAAFHKTQEFNQPAVFGMAKTAARELMEKDEEFNIPAAVIGGNIEGYLGFLAGSFVVQGLGLNPAEMLYVEQGGSSLQVAFQCDASQIAKDQGGLSTTTSGFLEMQSRLSRMFRRGPVTFTDKKLLKGKTVYSKSFLATGGNRLAAISIKEHCKHVQGENTCEHPCFANGLHITNPTKSGSEWRCLSKDGKTDIVAGATKICEELSKKEDKYLRSVFAGNGKLTIKGTGDYAECLKHVKSTFYNFEATAKNEVNDPYRIRQDLQVITENLLKCTNRRKDKKKHTLKYMGMQCAFLQSFDGVSKGAKFNLKTQVFDVASQDKYSKCETLDLPAPGGRRTAGWDGCLHAKAGHGIHLTLSAANANALFHFLNSNGLSGNTENTVFTGGEWATGAAAVFEAGQGAALGEPDAAFRQNDASDEADPEDAAFQWPK